MKVCVLGLWHLGTVTSACLASYGYDVVGLDHDKDLVKNLGKGQLPVFEPGLGDLVEKGLTKGRLCYSTDIKYSLKDTNVIWITFDTPVNENDTADVEFVVKQITELYPHLPNGSIVLVSSQLPVGTTRHLKHLYDQKFSNRSVSFACSPENLRLGSAISAFTQPERIVVGIINDADREILKTLINPITNCIKWMSVESAEMTKHALNAYMAATVAFTNEVATLCEAVGADAKQVEVGLKSDQRVSPKAYLSPGAAFGGGTLGRDITFLSQIAQNYKKSAYLINAVKKSNEAHLEWTYKKLSTLLDGFHNKIITVLGLTYKPGTDTLRRSNSVDLCKKISEQGSQVHAHDPAVKTLPEELTNYIKLYSSPISAMENASVLVIATEWPDYLELDAQIVISQMNSPIVIDPNRFLADTLGSVSEIVYATVGKGII